MENKGDPSKDDQTTGTGGSHPKIELQPADEWLSTFETDYPDLSQQYEALSQNDLHLAEIYRQALLDPQKPLNRVQAVRDESGQIWVDVFAEVNLESRSPSEMKPENIEEILDGVMEVRSSIGRLASGRVKADDLPKLEKLTTRIQAARPVGTTLDRSVKSIQSDQTKLTQEFPGQPPIDGRGVIVGIVDIGGCDFKHDNFLDDQGNSRVLFLWDQNGIPWQDDDQDPIHPAYGRQFSQNRINQALGASDPYADLAYKPKDAAHGTHVMDIAAGSGQWPGVAPGADLVFVHLGLPDPINMEEETLGSSPRLFDAVHYVFAIADALGKPAVVNLSVGMNGGAHDGNSMVEVGLDALLSTNSERAIVIAAGNSYLTRTHAMGEVPANGEALLEWRILAHAPVDYNQRQEMEIWYRKNTSLNVEVILPESLINPQGFSLGSCPLGKTMVLNQPGVSPPPLLVHHDAPLSDDENRINIFLDDRYHDQQILGFWKFRLYDAGQMSDGNIPFHAWIERNDDYPSRFSDQSSDPSHTLNTIGNAALPIVVGAFDPSETDYPITFYSSSGPSRNPGHTNKPEISAPGEDIRAARALHTGLMTESGTSMAAPHVSGVIALMFQAARERMNPIVHLDIHRIRDILLETAHPDPASSGPDHYDPRYGYGRLDGCAALKRLLE